MIPMFLIKLEDLNVVNKLTRICEQYKEKMDIDIVNGRYTVDGASVLGVSSLLGNIVKIIPNTDNVALLDFFYNDIKDIGAWKVKK